MKKKILMIGIVFLLILTNAITIYANTANGCIVSTDKTEAKAGDTFTVNVNVSSENGINAVEGFDYSYDENQLEVVEEKEATGFMKFEEDGVVTLMYSGTEVLNTADIYSITFRVKETVQENTTVSVTVGEATLFDINSAEFTISSQTITVNVVGEGGTEGEGETPDTTAPTVQSIAVTKPVKPTAGVLTGQEIEITATFSEAITGETVPTLKLKFGESAERTITNGTISGNKIVYKYTVVESDKGTLSVTGFSGGTIKDLAGNDAEISLKPLTGSQVVAEEAEGSGNGEGEPGDTTDTVKPTVESISVVSPETGTYEVGQIIKIDVTFSEKITGDKVPTLKIKFGTGEERTITNGKINGNKIQYTYTIVKGDQGKLAVTGYAGGTIKDLAGNEATISVKAVSGNAITADTKEDKSTAGQEYHKAGLGIGTILVMMALVVVSVVVYSRYKNMKDI